MQTLFLALLLGVVLSLLAPPLQGRVRGVLAGRRGLVWLTPFALTGVFAIASLLVGAFTIPLTAAVLVYTALPVAASWMGQDLLAVLLLWLPIEFAAGQSLVPIPARGFLHSVAYGVAILLGLTLFLGFRALPGLKYNLPRNTRDLWLPLAGFAGVAPVLIAVGMAIGFIPAPHLPVQPAGKMAGAVAIIFAGTALPEEILFRSLIQNLLMQRLGPTTRVLLLASVIFGAAHLDNGPQPLPNWRYMIVATIAGIAYGKVFQKSNSVCSSAVLHMMVDWTKHFFF
ncbi:Abortive infection protein [Candidatus Sulfopaludibacter sp. SbA3]|nr:Abortive infection protein [Candidatus Sulfopaludibacter sp. SbA3]